MLWRNCGACRKSSEPIWTQAAVGATALFVRLGIRVVRTTTREAELAKLLTNTWRYMKFAVANQFFMIADQAGVDYTNVLRAIRQDYPRAADLPGPGFAAGPCLFKDTMQLAAFTSDHFPMGQAAMQVNEGLPAYIVAALERRRGSLRGLTVGILGMAFKAESDDTRASLSYKLRKLLTWAGARVVCTDPYVHDARLVSIEVVVAESDVLILGAPHRQYSGLRLPGRDVVDVWGALGEGIRLVRILVTGAAGFICGYLVPELLEAGHEVVGVDNFSKYGPLAKSYDQHSRYRLVKGDAKDVALLTELAADCDQVVAAAAMIGGISYFHEFAYDLLAENERILAATFDAALAARRSGHLERIVVISSSMVYESTSIFPTPEGAQLTSPPPRSTYGFQKLASEYFARGALEQFGLPYTIVRPFNCVGIGERRAVRDSDVMSGNVKLALSHVVPDLVLKTIKGQDPLHILGNGHQVRHYTYGGDLAHGIRLAIESPAAVNDDFNLSTAQSTTVLELAQLIWRLVNGDRPFRTVSDPPFEHDVQLRVPDTSKAQSVLGFRASTSLETMLAEVIPWLQAEARAGRV